MMPMGPCTSATSAITLLLALALAACEGKYQAKVEGVWIPQADSMVAAADGPTFKMEVGVEMAALPDADRVRLAIERDVPWRDVRELLERIESAGNEPVLLVGKARRVGAFVLNDALTGDRAIQILTTAEGKACVGPPGTTEYKCVARGDREHVDRAYVRELVREAVGTYDLHDVEIEIPPELGWGDVVRVIDGARTCCGDTEMRVRLKG